MSETLIRKLSFGHKIPILLLIKDNLIINNKIFLASLKIIPNLKLLLPSEQILLPPDPQQILEILPPHTAIQSHRQQSIINNRILLILIGFEDLYQLAGDPWWMESIHLVDKLIGELAFV